MVQPDVTIYEAAAPRETLRLLLIALCTGGLVLFPSFFYLFRVFKGHLAVPGFPGENRSTSTESTSTKEVTSSTTTHTS
jgi:cytochrome d ubiquinol oxidase subunit II